MFKKIGHLPMGHTKRCKRLQAELKLSMDIAEESSMDSAKSMDGNSMLIAKSISSEKELRVTEGLGGAIKSM